MSLLLAASVMDSNEGFSLSRTCINALTYHIIILTCRPYHFAVVPTSIVSSSLIDHYVPSMPVSLPVPSNLPCKFRSPKQLCFAAFSIAIVAGHGALYIPTPRNGK